MTGPFFILKEKPNSETLILYRGRGAKEKFYKTLVSFKPKRTAAEQETGR